MENTIMAMENTICVRMTDSDCMFLEELERLLYANNRSETIRTLIREKISELKNNGECSF